MRIGRVALLLALCAGEARAAEPVVAEEAEEERFRYAAHRIFSEATIDVPRDWKVERDDGRHCGLADCSGRARVDFYLRTPWFKAVPGTRWAHLRIQRYPLRGRIKGEEKDIVASIKSLDDYAEEIDCTVVSAEAPSRYSLRGGKGPRLPMGGICGFIVEDGLPLPMGTARAFLQHTVGGSVLVPSEIPRMRKMVQYEIVYKIRGEGVIYSFELSTNRADRDWFAPAFARAVTSFRLPGRKFEPVDPKIVEQLETGWEMDSETLMNEHVEAVKARR